MSRPAIKPTVTVSQSGPNAGTDTFSHPAFGVAVLTQRSGGTGKLFGSDIQHQGTMAICVKTAKLDRHLGRDWIHGQDVVVDLEFTHAQFAQFITGVGKGDGTPCTLRYRATGQIEQMPGIHHLEEKFETHKREIREMAAKSIEDIRATVEKLEELNKGGSIPKNIFKGLMHSLRCQLDNVPSNMAFTVSSAEETLEKATAHAKIEVESFVSMKAQQLGLKHISQLNQITFDEAV